MRILRILAIVLLFVLLGTLLVHSLDSINQDIGRHLKTGQIIWETKSVPKTNLFSFTEPNTPFINHHWLSEVILFLLSGLIGLKGLILFKTGIILTAFFFIFKSLPPEAKEWPFIVSGGLGIFVFSNRTDVRPELFSYLFLAIFFFVIFKAKYEKNYKRFWTLPIIQLLWTNMHIYFVLGPALIFIFIIDRLVHKERRPVIKKLCSFFIITSAATLLNPNFLKGALEPFNILKNYGYRIVENQSVFFLKDYGILLRDINFFEISLVFLIFSFIIALKNNLSIGQTNQRKITFEIIVAAIFSILAGNMIRNFGIYALVFVPIVSINLSSYQPKFLSAQKLTLFLYPVFIALAVVMLVFVANNKYYDWMARPQRFGLTIPKGAADAVEFIKRNNIKGPVFNNFDVGSFMIWKLYPEQKVFVDGRPEAYSPEFFENIYKPMQEDPALWKKYSDLYKINYIFFDTKDITPWAQKFLGNIRFNPDWPLIYSDNDIKIFIRRTSEK